MWELLGRHGVNGVPDFVVQADDTGNRFRLVNTVTQVVTPITSTFSVHTALDLADAVITGRDSI